MAKEAVYNIHSKKKRNSHVDVTRQQIETQLVGNYILSGSLLDLFKLFYTDA